MANINNPVTWDALFEQYIYVTDLPLRPANLIGNLTINRLLHLSYLYTLFQTFE
jgi:hypothetical protein